MAEMVQKSKEVKDWMVQRVQKAIPIRNRRVKILVLASIDCMLYVFDVMSVIVSRETIHHKGDRYLVRYIAYNNNQSHHMKF